MKISRNHQSIYIIVSVWVYIAIIWHSLSHHRIIHVVNNLYWRFPIYHYMYIQRIKRAQFIAMTFRICVHAEKIWCSSRMEAELLYCVCAIHIETYRLIYWRQNRRDRGGIAFYILKARVIWPHEAYGVRNL